MTTKKKKLEEKPEDEELAEDEEWEYVYEDVEDDDEEEESDDEEEDAEDSGEWEYEEEDVEEDDDEEEEEKEEERPDPREIFSRSNHPNRPHRPEPPRLDPRQSLFHRRGGRPGGFTPGRGRAHARPSHDFGRGESIRNEYEPDAESGMAWEEMEAKIRAGEYKPGPNDSWPAQMLYKLLKQGGDL